MAMKRAGIDESDSDYMYIMSTDTVSDTNTKQNSAIYYCADVCVVTSLSTCILYSLLHCCSCHCNLLSYTVTQKTGPATHSEITPTNLNQ